MSMLTAVSLWLMLGLLPEVDPEFPPNSVLGGTVVAELHFVAGGVKNVKILSGDGPFVNSCKSALEKWHTDSKLESDELIIVHFRQPYLFYLSNPREEIHAAKPKKSLPYPIYIVQPSYPPDALAQGSVVLQLDISAEGQISDVHIVKSLGVLTQTSIDAVRQWKFAPARDTRGNATASHAYAVLVYRFPLIVP
jgi:TonB family protein